MRFRQGCVPPGKDGGLQDNREQTIREKKVGKREREREKEKQDVSFHGR